MIESYSPTDGKRIKGASVFANSSYVRYGQEKDAKQEVIRIISIDDETTRHAEIDKLIEKFESNSDENSFFKRDEPVRILLGAMGGTGFAPKVRIDDPQLYYIFFDTFKMDYEKHKNEHSFGGIYEFSVKRVVRAYFGEYNGDAQLRNKLLEPKFEYKDGDEDNFEVVNPSIEILKREFCAQCVERASVAHNLWLLGGFESTYVSSGTIQLAASNDQGHAYCLIKGANSYELFDPAREVYQFLDKDLNPRELILEGNPLEVTTKDGNKHIYANAPELDADKTNQRAN